MSAEYQDQDPIALAKQAERDLNSYEAKQGLGAKSDSGEFLSSPMLFYLATYTRPTTWSREILPTPGQSVPSLQGIQN